MKKSLKCLSVILVILITLFSFSITALAQTTEQDGLQVSLTTNKQSYSLNEDIEIIVSVTNTNDFTVEDVSIESLLPDNFELKDSKQNTSAKAVDLKAGEQTSLSVIAVVKGQEEKPTEPSAKPDDKTKPTENTTNNNDNNKFDKSDKNTNIQNNKNGTSPYTGADYTFMGIFIVLFLASVSTLFYCLIKRFKKTTKIVSSVLCAVIAVTSVIGFSTFNAFAQENKSTITVSEQIKVDNNDYTITTNVSYKVNDNINLTIDNEQETVVNFNQKLSGKFSLTSNVVSVTYTIATEIDDYEITDSGNALINGNTYSVDIQLKPQINKITVTATTESGKTESKTVKITYDSGKIYELDENHIAYDSETNTHYVDNIILIFFDEGVSDDRKNEIVSSINGKVVGSINGVNQWQVEVGTNDTNGLKEICNKLMNLQEIVYADFDRITNVSNDIVANDPYKNSDGGDWYLDAINAYSAWNYNERFNNINIGIVDNGFDVGHEDLRGKIKFPQQWLEDTNSKEYHGTHVAGIIGAIAGNEKGITGLLWNSNLYCVDWEPIKKQEWNTQNRLLSALSYTVEAGSKVINYSLGQTAVMPNGVTDWSIDYINEIGRKSSVYMYQLLNKGKDFIVVQSAGNGTSGKNNPDDDKEERNPENVLAVDAINNGYFCSVTEENAFEAKNITKQDILDRIIIVGAAQKNDDGNYQQAVFSNGGKQVDICAPGTKIFSTVPWEYGNYMNLDGTSMSAPMVTAVCGMVWSVNSKFTGAEVKDIVCNSYDENIWVWDNPDGKHTTNDNYRMLNAKLSVEEAIRRTDGTGNIIGRVKEQGTNAPISNREVKIYNENYTSDNAMYTFVDKTKTNSNGNFKISLPAGTYTLVIDNDGENANSGYYYDTVEMKVKVDAGVDTFLLNDIILARRENGITGYVYDHNDLINNGKNTPIADVTVEVYQNNNGTTDYIGKCKTDENGKYTFAVDKNGSYDLSFIKSGYKDTKELIVVNGGYKTRNAYLVKSISTDKENGTKENPYKVSNVEELKAVKNDLSAYYIQVADIDLKGENWTPISDENNHFIGGYDGNGHTISNLKYSEYNIGNKYIGLFGYNDGDLKNITVNNICLEGFSPSSIDYYVPCYLGGIAGYNTGEINNCKIASGIIQTWFSYNGYVYGTYSGAMIYAGGISGNNSGTIYKCANSAKININSSQSAYVGGISGDNRGGKISNSLNTADLSGYCKMGDFRLRWDMYCYVSGITNRGDTTNCLCTAKNIIAKAPPSSNSQISAIQYIDTSAWFIGGSSSGKNYALKEAYVFRGKTHYAYKDEIVTKENSVVLTDADTINNIWNSY